MHIAANSIEAAAQFGMIQLQRQHAADALQQLRVDRTTHALLVALLGRVAALDAAEQPLHQRVLLPACRHRLASQLVRGVERGDVRAHGAGRDARRQPRHPQTHGVPLRWPRAVVRVAVLRRRSAGKSARRCHMRLRVVLAASESSEVATCALATSVRAGNGDEHVRRRAGMRDGSPGSSCIALTRQQISSRVVSACDVLAAVPQSGSAQR